MSEKVVRRQSKSTKTGSGTGFSSGPNKSQSISALLTFAILFLAWVSGFASRLFAVIRFESIIHEFDPW